LPSVRREEPAVPHSLLPLHTPQQQTTFYRNRALRQSYVVYGSGTELVLRETSTAGGASTERRCPREVVERVAEHFAGRTVTVRQVVDEVRVGRFVVDLSGHGPLLSYAIRDVLLVLTVLGACRVDTATAEHHYTIDPLREHPHA
jgi:hypothetical protein